MLQGWTLGHNHNVTHAKQGDGRHEQGGWRHQNYACPDTLTASPPSPSFPVFSSISVCNWFDCCTGHKRQLYSSLCHWTLVSLFNCWIVPSYV